VARAGEKGASAGGLGPQVSANLGNFSAQLTAPWLYPGSGYNNFDVSVNLNLTSNVSLVCDPSNESLGGDLKDVLPFELQVSGSSTGAQIQATIDTGNPNIGLQLQLTIGTTGVSGSVGIGGSFE
jgi:hypothetical protein